jgi:hypothetical protein
LETNRTNLLNTKRKRPKNQREYQTCPGDPVTRSSFIVYSSGHTYLRGIKTEEQGKEGRESTKKVGEEARE